MTHDGAQEASTGHPMNAPGDGAVWSARLVRATTRLSAATDESELSDGVDDLARVLFGGRPAGMGADVHEARETGRDVLTALLRPGSGDQRVVWVAARGPRDQTSGGPEDQVLLETLAVATATACRNLDRERSAARRRRWLEASAEITASLVGRTDEQAALQLVADRAREVGRALAAWIAVGPDPERLEFRVVSGPVLDMDRLRSLPMGGSVTVEVARHGRPLRVADLGTDPRLARFHALPGSVRVGPAIMVPLPRASGVAGVLGLGWAPKDHDVFERLDSDLPAGFAEQVSLALKVSRMHRDARHLAVLRDRDRIGRDLHDLVIQRLFAIGLSLAALERMPAEERRLRLDQAVEQVDEAIGDLRDAIHSLGAPGADTDVVEEVSGVLGRVTPALGLRPTLRLSGPVRTATPAHVVPEVVAVLSEALSNAARHADAGSVGVTLGVAHGVLELVVVDDGRGIADSRRRSGLDNMARRAERLDGTCVVDRPAGGGTRVTWCVPVE